MRNFIKFVTEDKRFPCPVCGYQPVAVMNPVFIHCPCGRIQITMPELWECNDVYQATAMLKFKYEEAHYDIIEKCPVCKGAGKLWWNYTEVTRIDGARSTIKKINHWTLNPSKRQRESRHENPFDQMKPCFRCRGDGEVPKIDGIDNSKVEENGVEAYA